MKKQRRNRNHRLLAYPICGELVGTPPESYYVITMNKSTWADSNLEYTMFYALLHLGFLVVGSLTFASRLSALVSRLLSPSLALSPCSICCAVLGCAWLGYAMLCYAMLAALSPVPDNGWSAQSFP